MAQFPPIINLYTENLRLLPCAASSMETEPDLLCCSSSYPAGWSVPSAAAALPPFSYGGGVGSDSGLGWGFGRNFLTSQKMKAVTTTSATIPPIAAPATSPAEGELPPGGGGVELEEALVKVLDPGAVGCDVIDRVMLLLVKEEAEVLEGTRCVLVVVVVVTPDVVVVRLFTDYLKRKESGETKWL
ncbi:uncharacterized protein EI90DRAFT_3067823 [Cantharellus anzutake]|uniref:uncharacterized protein n=1 Tax=Cantharellus anzutake TaxID=1750568 RepID=UPI001903F911|nr:uncharacterized protein EI90DRAFT_3067823 [Cantharellus anzutake]KAF8327447.1 hypothetical protein EI90DRAFT_3067823 [Cantharellus anzutake]